MGALFGELHQNYVSAPRFTILVNPDFVELERLDKFLWSGAIIFGGTEGIVGLWQTGSN